MRICPAGSGSLVFRFHPKTKSVAHLTVVIFICRFLVHLRGEVQRTEGYQPHHASSAALCLPTAVHVTYVCSRKYLVLTHAYFRCRSRHVKCVRT